MKNRSHNQSLRTNPPDTATQTHGSNTPISTKRVAQVQFVSKEAIANTPPSYHRDQTVSISNSTMLLHENLPYISLFTMKSHCPSFRQCHIYGLENSGLSACNKKLPATQVGCRKQDYLILRSFRHGSTGQHAS